MKTPFVTLALMLSVLTARTQISIGPEAFPAPGDVESFYPFEGEIDPGNAGAGVTWNFNELVLESVETSNYVSPQASDWFTVFPAATVANSEEGDCTFLTVNAQFFEELGTASPDGSVLKYDNPVRRAVFPIELGDTFVDEFTGTYLDGGQPYGSIEGSIESTADATGTVVVNGLTYTNCIRLHQVQTYTTSMGGFTSLTTVDWYLWFAEGIKLPVIEYGLFEVESTEINFTYAGGAVTAANPVSVGISDPSFTEEFAVYPNPAQDMMWVSGQAGLQYSLLDLNGKVVMHGVMSSDRAALRVNQLPDGLYFVRLTDGTRRTTTHRVIIE